jgi:hypothetical protein
MIYPVEPAILVGVEEHPDADIPFDGRRCGLRRAQAGRGGRSGLAKTDAVGKRDGRQMEGTGGE